MWGFGVPNSENQENNENTTVVSAETIEINTYKTVNEHTELYIIPLINASKIHTIEPNQKLYIIQILNGWAYVSSENNYGWLRCSELN